MAEVRSASTTACFEPGCEEPRIDFMSGRCRAHHNAASGRGMKERRARWGGLLPREVARRRAAKALLDEHKKEYDQLTDELVPEVERELRAKGYGGES